MAEAQAKGTRAAKTGARSLARMAKASDAARMAPKTHWEEKWVGRIRGYPLTPEAFVARQQRGRALFARLRAEGKSLTRKGIPDGYAGCREEVEAGTAKARADAAEAMKHLRDQDCSPDERDGNAALTVALEIAMTPWARAATRLKAAALVASYTKLVPPRVIEVEVSPAEKWLDLLAAPGAAEGA